MRIPLFSCLLLTTFQCNPKRIFLVLMFLFQISSFTCVSGQCLNDQRSLLLQLNNTLVYDSSRSTKLVQWNQDVDCCNWNGVECDSFGHVIGLELDGEWISGGIENSSALYNFRYLEELNLALYNNYFDGTQIPRELGNLTSLARLKLSGFSGQIPIQLSQMTSLVMLALSTGFYSDLQPLKLEDPNLKIFVQNLTSLEELYLEGVEIRSQGDWLESLSLALPNLRSLSLIFCDLSGTLNPSFLQLQSLSVLRLDWNDLSATDLNFFTNFRNLTILSLRNCSLQGNFPEMIFQVPTLQHLDLSSNFFTGPIPSTIGILSELVSLDFSSNFFTGPIPSTIGNLSELVSLDFSSNFFIGPIPIFSMSKKLTTILLYSNDLNGSLSSTHFEGLTNLSELDLGNNSLTGNIPTSLFRLPSIHGLYLFNNKFSGQVNDFSTLNSTLEALDLSYNQLEGPIPGSFYRLENLQDLRLSFNLFNGTIQLEKFQNHQNLQSLELGYNHLSVNISSGNSELSSFPQLHWLNLASCNLSRFPNLRNQTNLLYLDLSNNNISGDIPSWIWEIGNRSLEYLNLSYNTLVNLQNPYQIPYSLSSLDLSSNMLRGELPVFQNLPKYVDYSSVHFSRSTFYSVANNNLTGEIPLSLCNAANLEVLDLSGNLLNGGLPPCLVQNLTYLGVLNIGGNNINGSIPDTFSVNCTLQTLELSRNNLRGKIPASLANCKSLQVMNVASNNIKDTFPCILKNSSSLHVLVLRSNKFYGDISCPMFNHNWPNLQIIDIAFNSFSGFLDPGFVSSWTGMKLKNSTQLTQNPLRFNLQRMLGVTYQDKVTVTLKGMNLEIVRILTTFNCIDLSSNNFQGVIPDTVGELISLYVLNLSHNSFTGTIPRSIGNLTNLESLDLSTNQLVGEIPVELTSLTFLEFLNVSYNNLFGRIPSGRQFNTFEEASYKGNTRLCGSPVNRSCDPHEPPTETSAISSGEKDVDWIFILAGLGYAVGVALVVVPSLFSRRWGERLEDLQVKLLKLICPA